MATIHTAVPANKACRELIDRLMSVATVHRFDLVNSIDGHDITLELLLAEEFTPELDKKLFRTAAEVAHDTKNTIQILPIYRDDME